MLFNMARIVENDEFFFAGVDILIKMIVRTVNKLSIRINIFKQKNS